MMLPRRNLYQNKEKIIPLPQIKPWTIIGIISVWWWLPNGQRRKRRRGHTGIHILATRSTSIELFHSRIASFVSGVFLVSCCRICINCLGVSFIIPRMIRPWLHWKGWIMQHFSIFCSCFSRYLTNTHTLERGIELRRCQQEDRSAGWQWWISWVSFLCGQEQGEPFYYIMQINWFFWHVFEIFDIS